MKTISTLLILLLSYLNLSAQKCIKGDCSNGVGTMLYQDSSKYQGNWRNNKKNGQGIYYFKNGHTYVGTWVDDKKTGQGTYT
ncbi:MAG: hypothetical protein M3R17_18930 [Bacteroidota bacterium]|nr:hypothetical protein [Bacteroidota bacterium]